MVAVQAEQFLAQLDVALQRRCALTHGIDQVRHHGSRNRIAIQRSIERAGEIAGLGAEPVVLQYAVVDGGVGVGRCRISLQVSIKSRGTISLLVVGRQHGLVSAG